MSDINDEQKRLYKRAEENDIKIIEPSEEECFVGIIKEYQRKVDDLQDRINEAYKVLDEITFYTTPIGQVVHLDMIISDIRKVKSILKGDNK